MRDKRGLKYISLGLSLLLTGFLVLQWWYKDRVYNPDDKQLVSEQVMEKMLQEYSASHGVRIPTGVFVQSLKFLNSVDVHLSGYLWQIYNREIHKEELDDVRPGVIFPEAVDNAGTFIMEKAYEREEGENRVVIGWYFEVILRQKFNYSDYPLDHKTVWIRMWHRDFLADRVLVPDLRAYKGTGYNDVFGVDEHIVLDDWTIDECYFDFQKVDIGTDFGMTGFSKNRDIPELRFNLVIKRKFSKPFTVNLVPLMVVAFILFSVLVSTTFSQRNNSLIGFSVSGSLGTCSGLFFTVLISHVQLRNEIPASGVYLEYFYLLMYLVIFLVALNIYIVSHLALYRENSILVKRDNLCSKLIFWPLVLGAMNLITWFSLF